MQIKKHSNMDAAKDLGIAAGKELAGGVKLSALVTFCMLKIFYDIAKENLTKK
jgi:hypothetical protein